MLIEHKFTKRFSLSVADTNSRRKLYPYEDGIIFVLNFQGCPIEKSEGKIVKVARNGDVIEVYTNEENRISGLHLLINDGFLIFDFESIEAPSCNLGIRDLKRAIYLSNCGLITNILNLCDGSYEATRIFEDNGNMIFALNNRNDRHLLLSIKQDGEINFIRELNGNFSVDSFFKWDTDSLGYTLLSGSLCKFTFSGELVPINRIMVARSSNQGNFLVYEYNKTYIEYCDQNFNVKWKFSLRYFQSYHRIDEFGFWGEQIYIASSALYCLLNNATGDIIWSITRSPSSQKFLYQNSKYICFYDASSDVDSIEQSLNHYLAIINRDTGKEYLIYVEGNITDCIIIGEEIYILTEVLCNNPRTEEEIFAQEVLLHSFEIK